MSKTNGGGSAFPSLVEYDSSGYPSQDGSGMTLRDWLAGQALTGLLAGSPDADCGPDGYAHDAYSYADAMLRAREASHE